MSLSNRSNMNRFAIAILLALTVTIGALSERAHAEPRLALVVGNGAYTTVTPLDNPVNDASLMADALRKVGFEVTLRCPSPSPTPNPNPIPNPHHTHNPTPNSNPIPRCLSSSAGRPR